MGRERVARIRQAGEQFLLVVDGAKIVEITKERRLVRADGGGADADQKGPMLMGDVWAVNQILDKIHDHPQ